MGGSSLVFLLGLGWSLWGVKSWAGVGLLCVVFWGGGRVVVVFRFSGVAKSLYNASARSLTAL